MLPDHEAKKELEEISPFLSGLPKQMPHSIPEGYFESLPGQMLARVREAKVVAMPRRSALVRQLAVAAIALGIIVTAGWFLLTRTGAVENTVAQHYDTPLHNSIRPVSDAEMADFVDRSDLIPTDDAPPDVQFADDDVSLVLADVSDQDLQQYIDQGNTLPNLN